MLDKFQMHKLSDQQYTWAALTARARKKQWKDCEELVVTKVGTVKKNYFSVVVEEKKLHFAYPRL